VLNNSTTTHLVTWGQRQRLLAWFHLNNPGHTHLGTPQTSVHVQVVEGEVVGAVTGSFLSHKHDGW
jgi:hypothetical protein